MLDLVLDPADGAGVSWLYRHTEVLEKALDEDGKLAMTVRVDPDKAGVVRAKFPALPAQASYGSAACSGLATRAAFAASQSASISASVASSGLLAARGQRPLDRGEAALEFLVGGAQRGLRIDVEMAGEIDHGEQQVADLGLRPCRRRRAAISASISSPSSRIFASTAIGSFQSKPTLPALACSFSARVRAGRATGTPASAPASCGCSPRAARSAFSSALIRSQRPLTASGGQRRERRRTRADGGGSAWSVIA